MLHAAPSINLRCTDRWVQVPPAPTTRRAARRPRADGRGRGGCSGGPWPDSASPQLLDRAQVYPSHHEPGGESMAAGFAPW